MIENWINILTAESKTYVLFYMTLVPPCLGGYSAQAIKECIDYELKSADNPCVLTNFCKLLSLTYYRICCTFLMQGGLPLALVPWCLKYHIGVKRLSERGLSFPSNIHMNCYTVQILAQLLSSFDRSF